MMLLVEAVELMFSGRALPRGGPDDPLLPVLGLKDVGIELTPVDQLERTAVPAGQAAERLSLRAGDVVVTSRTARVRAAVAEETHRGVLVGPNLIVVRPGERISGTLVAALLRHPVVQDQLLAEFASRTPPGFTVERLGRLRIAIPPVSEQAALAELVAVTEAHALAVSESVQLRQAATYELVHRRLHAGED
jgi:type I restriction enzyme S subunit